MPLDDESKVQLAELVGELQAKLQDKPPRSLEINPNNILIPISGVVVLIGAVWGIAIAFSSFQTAQKDLRKDVDKFNEELRKNVDEMKIKRWTKQHQKAWAREMQASNPSMKVPDVNDVIQQVE